MAACGATTRTAQGSASASSSTYVDRGGGDCAVGVGGHFARRLLARMGGWGSRRLLARRPHRRGWEGGALFEWSSDISSILCALGCMDVWVFAAAVVSRLRACVCIVPAFPRRRVSPLTSSTYRVPPTQPPTRPPTHPLTSGRDALQSPPTGAVPPRGPAGRAARPPPRGDFRRAGAHLLQGPSHAPPPPPLWGRDPGHEEGDDGAV